MDEEVNPAAPMTLGSALRQAHERLGLSLRDLEAITVVSRLMLHRLEHDQVEQPNPAVLQQLADTLELNSDDLFAFVSYRPSTQLPSLAPYLRAKYQLPPDALAEAQAALQGILARYDPDPTHDPPGRENTGR
jgi:transcriptional regulator with XRE-family HTH domain